ncbi:MAG: hypothetical protein JWO15_2508 [Sphingomonadales bacterium]|nr:hypothetical protein [Sphingomonadales bacterium]
MSHRRADWLTAGIKLLRELGCRKSLAETILAQHQSTFQLTCDLTGFPRRIGIPRECGGVRWE